MGSKKKTRPSGVLLSGVLVVLAALVAVASLVPVPRLWGVNHLAYFSTPVRLAALGLIALSLVPPVAGSIHRRLTGWLAFPASGRRSLLVALLVSLLAVGGFFAFQAGSLLLGDGHMIGSTYDKALAGDATMNTSSVAKILKNKHIEPGAAILYLVGARGITAITGGSGSDAIRLFNCLLGGLFVLTLLLVVLRGGFPAELRLWLAILVFTSGAMELFFGYVEYYTPLILCGTFYVIASFRAVHRRGPVWLPALLALACAFIHIQAILLLPSLMIIVVWRMADRDTVLKPLSLTLGGLTMVAFAAAYLVPRSAAFLLPIVGKSASAGVLSLGHGLDLLNEFLLLFPLTVLFWVMWMQVRKDRPQPKKPDSAAAAWFTLPVEWHFSLMLLLPLLLFVIFFKPEIGMARDWDLFSLVVLGLVPVALLILNRFLAVRPDGLRSVTVPALTVALVLAVGWVGVNASPVRSAARFADILTYESSRSDYSWETLARHYQAQGLLPEAIEAQRKAIAISGNPRQVVNLCVMFRDAGMIDDSKQLLRDLLVVNPTYWNARSILIRQLILDQQFEEGIAQSMEGIRVDPKLGGYHFYYGRIMLILGRLDEAEPALLKARRLGVPPSMAAEIERMLAALPGLRN